ncbi:hypothetical protein G7Y31_03455 [Corynebacterium lizhenjunii]|uniref:DUF3558 domain-containing protein n=1 Tax=Corynebacterium lizhenjunii TaxID=2709394 RepID=A0A7T0PCI6_9CORY|nr:hypothetical protein [Corynebacterium lizhenjunii]QPK79767.1 hypothetical protein G7Y31_03455 [Corynebacterium lizhenjunii]
MRAQSLITAFALVATGCFALAGCARPSPPGPESVPVVEQASEAKSADATAAGFAMPAPGPFDPNAPDYTPFQPCQDISQEQFAELGLKVVPEEQEHYLPYACPVELPELEGRGALALVAYPDSLSQLLDGRGLVIAEEPSADLPGGAVLVSQDPLLRGVCMSGVETPRGFFAVEYVSGMSVPSGVTLCEVPTKILREIYGATND